MTRWIFLFALGPVLALPLAGCNGDGPDPDRDAAVSQISSLGDIARAAGGNYDQLSEDDKQKFLERTGGDEQQARAMVQQMTGNNTGQRGAGAPTN